MYEPYANEYFMNLNNEIFKVLGDHSTARGRYISFAKAKPKDKNDTQYHVMLRKEYEVMLVWGSWRILNKTDLFLYG